VTTLDRPMQEVEFQIQPDLSSVHGSTVAAHAPQPGRKTGLPTAACGPVYGASQDGIFSNRFFDDARKMDGDSTSRDKSYTDGEAS